MNTRNGKAGRRIAGLEEVSTAVELMYVKGFIFVKVVSYLAFVLMQHISSMFMNNFSCFGNLDPQISYILSQKNLYPNVILLLEGRSL